MGWEKKGLASLEDEDARTQLGCVCSIFFLPVDIQHTPGVRAHSLDCGLLWMSTGIWKARRTAVPVFFFRFMIETSAHTL